VLYVPPQHAADFWPFAVNYDEWLDTNPDSFAAVHLDRHHSWLFFTKEADWAQEREFRIVLNSSDGDAEIEFQDALVEICVGDRISPDDFSALVHAAGVQGCSVSRIIWRNGAASRVPVK
jgi:hypothetical protein